LNAIRTRAAGGVVAEGLHAACYWSVGRYVTTVAGVQTVTQSTDVHAYTQFASHPRMIGFVVSAVRPLIGWRDG